MILVLFPFLLASENKMNIKSELLKIARQICSSQKCSSQLEYTKHNNPKACAGYVGLKLC